MKKIYKSKWSEGNFVKDSGEIGTLDMSGNKMKFVLSGKQHVFSTCFVAHDDHFIKVFTNGSAKSTEEGYEYFVEKVFVYNGTDYSEFTNENVENINELRFSIYRISDWLKLKGLMTVEYEEIGPVIQFCDIQEIVLREKSPRITIKYEKVFPFFSEDELTKLTFENKPFVTINYEESVDDYRAKKDIRVVSRFLGLLIGRVTKVEDIRFNFSDKTSSMWFYYNADFSHHAEVPAYLYKHRMLFSDIKGCIINYFDKWYNLAQDKDFKLLIDTYYDSCSHRKNDLIDYFLGYCKFLEGYDLRKSNDEDKANVLYNDILTIMKMDNQKEIFSSVFTKADSKFDAKRISQWISSGFLSRIGLAQRISRLDKMCFGIIKYNQKYFINENEDIYRKIVNTRNYYSHYKVDDAGILTMSQIYRITSVLEAMVIIILLSEIGAKKDNIKEIMSHDEIYWSEFPRK